MSRAKFEAARELIQQKNYSAARAILEAMPDEPRAVEWLAKLDQVAPRETPAGTPSRGGSGLLIVVIVVLLALIIGAGLVYTQRDRIPLVAALFATATLPPTLTPSATETATATSTGTSAPTAATTATGTPTRTPAPSKTSLPTSDVPATDSPTRADSSQGKWQTDASKSELDNTKTATLILDSDNKINGSILRVTPTLIVRCKGNKTDVYVAAGTQLERDYSTDTLTIRYKFDAEGVQSETADASTSGNAFFFVAPRTMVKDFRNHKKLVVGFRPFESGDTEAVFDLRGFSQAVATVDQNCGW